MSAQGKESVANSHSRYYPAGPKGPAGSYFVRVAQGATRRAGERLEASADAHPRSFVEDDDEAPASGQAPA